MQNQYRNYIEKYVISKLKKSQQNVKVGVSIITCTNKDFTLNNILENYIRQDYDNKELIIILNKDNIDLDLCLDIITDYENVEVYQLSEKTSLGKCLNYAVSKSKYPIIAKFDDDYYYGPLYLSDTLKSFKDTSADFITKASNFVYFIEKELLAIRTPGEENKFVRFGNGSTFVFKKKIFKKVKFRDISLAEDVYFCQDCIKNNIKIYSTNKYHHVYFRHPIKENHTWKISDDEFIEKYCRLIGPIKDYISYANNTINQG